MLNAAAAKVEIAKLATANRLRLDEHAQDRADERGASYRDVRCALMGATSCVIQPNGRYCLVGRDLDGDELTTVCIIEQSVVVVTLF
jgi:hypothetical protein